MNNYVKGSYYRSNNSCNCASNYRCSKLMSLLIIMSVVASVMLLVSINVSAYDLPDIQYSWDGYKCSVTVPSELGEEVYFDVNGDVIDNFNPGETVYFDFEQSVNSAFNNGDDEYFVEILLTSGREDYLYLSCTFKCYNTVVTSDIVPGNDTAISVIVDSFYKCNDPSSGIIEKVTDSELPSYYNWINNTIIIRKGECSSQDRIILQKINSVDMYGESRVFDGYNNQFYFKLPDGTVVDETGLSNIFVKLSDNKSNDGNDSSMSKDRDNKIGADTYDNRDLLLYTILALTSAVYILLLVLGRRDTRRLL